MLIYTSKISSLRRIKDDVKEVASGYEYGEDEWITLQKATKGNNGGINIVLLGDGFNAKDIASGEYLKDIKQEVEYFFGIEPYKTYRDYFNVYTAMPLSTESGVGTVNTIRYNRFNTTYTGGVGLKADYDEDIDYDQYDEYYED